MHLLKKECFSLIIMVLLPVDYTLFTYNLLLTE
uniref:Uncharacterized protein n=1 Tax=Siphoviridae sp. ctwQg18 TaxID=2826516 RepID=A0A8S5MIJ5_9CAUD|nr:MAG TPA: hypothetical protein [Siphoviridae sp. ctwQg18]DAD82201.1 MAG TPA: hypothetical protein [Siphoviridae sp. ctwQg18]